MKKPILILFCLSLMFSFLSCNKNEATKEANFGSGTLKTGGNVFIFGTRSHPCNEEGCYCTGDRGICIIIRIETIIKSAIPNHSFLPNSGAGEITMLPNNQIKLSMLYDNSSVDAVAEKVFYVTEDMEFPNAVVDGTLVILKGEYDIDYTNNPLGDIIVDYIIK